MNENRWFKNLLFFSMIAVLFCGLPLQAIAQEEEASEEEQATEEEKESAETFSEEIVVTGTRAQPRSAVESMVPIDVISSDDFTKQGDTDLSNQLRTLVPSYNVNTQPISDAATVVRPANLRNLAPDHTLVLINGKRRHRAAVIYWLGNGVADGAQGPDISTIPSIALRQVEVLRDGASAQYGSDAIAGVLNFLLKDSSEGGSFELRTGGFTAGDGNTTSFAGNIGLPLGETGFANFSIEIGQSDATDRSVQRDDAAALIAAGNTAVANPAQVWGSPETEDDIKFWGNFGYLTNSGKQLYAHTNYASKTVTGGFYFRNPNTRSAVFSGDGGQTLLIGDLLDAQDGILDGSANCPVVNIVNNVPDPAALAAVIANPNCFSFQELFPGGFTPQFGGDVEDYSVVAGIRGQTGGGLVWDASVSTGSNEVDFFITNTVNASLGPDTPRSSTRASTSRKS
jgi:iron complex outermembrane receptor protein